MSILIDEHTRVLIQGITGRAAARHTRYMLDYGTQIVAGVSPGKGGQQVEGVPVFDTVAEAVAARGPIEATAIFVRALGVLDAALEAIEAQIPLLLVPSEGVPFSDGIYMVHAAAEQNLTLIGPNAQGLISPGKAKLGATGGDNPQRLFASGPVGVISRSGGMGQETCWLLKQEGIGQSSYVAIGGELINGVGFVDVARLFEQDQETELIVIFGEPGTEREEQLAAAMVAGEIRKPVVAYVPGDFVESRGSGLAFGHAGAVIDGKHGAPSYKRQILAEAGARIADRWSSIPRLVREGLAERQEQLQTET